LTNKGKKKDKKLFLAKRSIGDVPGCAIILFFVRLKLWPVLQ